MRRSQDQNTSRFSLRTERLGPLPLVNYFLERMGLANTLDRCVPTNDRRTKLPHAVGLGVLLRSIIVEREPIYRQQEIVQTFAPAAYGLSQYATSLISDDRIGRALDRLFDSDRLGLLTEGVVAAAKRFHLKMDELHNDSTSIRFCGRYRKAKGRQLRGQRAPFITYGLSKDHRPDLKQLLFILTVSADGGVPVQFRCCDGNTSDSTTHIETWKTLCDAVGRTDFLYVADSKLCAGETMDYINDRKGRFVTVLPRSRLEDAEFRDWLQTHSPSWERVWDRPNSRKKGGPRDRWHVYSPSLPSREGWPVVWVFSSLLKLAQEHTRREQLAAAEQRLGDLKARLAAPASRIRDPAAVDRRIKAILERGRLRRYLNVRRTVHEEHTFRQMQRGRPGPATPYKRITRRRPDLEWALDEDAIEYDRKSDGMYPLITNDRTLTPAQVLKAHKRQPKIEKRFEQAKSIHNIAPVFLKNEGRIEALFTLYFLALLVQSLIERQIRIAMQKQQIRELPLYPEERSCTRPTTDQILRLFSHTQRHELLDTKTDRIVQVFYPDLTDLQRQVLALLEVPEAVFRQPS